MVFVLVTQERLHDLPESQNGTHVTTDLPKVLADGGMSVLEIDLLVEVKYKPDKLSSLIELVCIDQVLIKVRDVLDVDEGLVSSGHCSKMVVKVDVEFVKGILVLILDVSFEIQRLLDLVLTIGEGVFLELMVTFNDVVGLGQSLLVHECWPVEEKINVEGLCCILRDNVDGEHLRDLAAVPLELLVEFRGKVDLQLAVFIDLLLVDPLSQVEQLVRVEA